VDLIHPNQDRRESPGSFGHDTGLFSVQLFVCLFCGLLSELLLIKCLVMPLLFGIKLSKKKDDGFNLTVPHGDRYSINNVQCSFIFRVNVFYTLFVIYENIKNAPSVIIFWYQVIKYLVSEVSS
jgi:hypothetical protein